MFYFSLTRRIPTGQESAWQVVEKAASAQRFKEYLNASNNDGPRALELYTWNTEISAAFWAQLGAAPPSFVKMAVPFPKAPELIIGLDRLIV